MEKPNYVPVTLEGLHHWLKHEYEHLGWMALCLSKGESAKAYAYALSLDKLKIAINERKGMGPSSPHIERDLDVLSYKLANLEVFAEKLGISKNLLASVCKAESMTGGAKKRLSKKPSKTSSKKSSKKPSKKSSRK